MALHGKIMANNDVVWRWQARRREPLANPFENSYEVFLDNPNDGRIYNTIITHVYEDGALELVRKVMEWAVEATKEE